MKIVVRVLPVVLLTAIVEAQVVPRVSSSAYEPYVRQLGDLHFPGGEARREDRISAVESLASGAIVVAGHTYGALGEPHAGTGTTSDLFVARFDEQGALAWVSQVGALTAPTIPALHGDPSGPGGDASQYEFARDLALAPDGSIFVTGSSNGSLGETNGGGSDIVLAKFDASGTLLWLRQLGVETAATIVPEPGATDYGDPSGGEAGASLFVHPDGGIYVGGSTGSNLSEQTSDGWDFFLARYDASGTLEWVRQMSDVSAPQIGFDADYFDDLGGIALHPSGRIVLAGTKWWQSGTIVSESPIVMTFDGAGHPLDWTGFGDQFRLHDVAIDPASGRILVAGHFFFSTEYQVFMDAFAASLDADLGVEWTAIMDPTTTAHLGLQDLSLQEWFSAVRVDASGDLILVGSTQGSLNEPQLGFGYDVFSAKIRGTDGHFEWVSQIGQTTATALGIDTSGDDLARGAALGPGRTVFLAGSTDGSLGEPHSGEGDALLIRVDRVGRLR